MFNLRFKDISVNACAQWPHSEAVQKVCHHSLLLAAFHCLSDLSPSFFYFSSLSSAYFWTASTQMHSYTQTVKEGSTFTSLHTWLP